MASGFAERIRGTLLLTDLAGHRHTFGARVSTDVWPVWFRIAAAARTHGILTLQACPVALVFVMMFGRTERTPKLLALTDLAAHRCL